MTSRSLPIAMTIAGSDPSGGAGIQADLKTFSAYGVYGASIITALTAQNTQGVSGVFPIPSDFIAAQFVAVIGDLRLGAVKTGMLGDAVTVATVANLLSHIPDTPVVVDPVMVATSGDVLLAPEAIEAVRSELIPRATLITPNVPEAARLLGTGEAETEADMITQAVELLQFGCKAVLLKGGHGAGSDAVDILAHGEARTAFKVPRIATRNTHGTGCTLSAAIAAGFAQGQSLQDAIVAAKAYVWQALKAGADLEIGQGNGPIDHHFALRSGPPRKQPA
jgi:hydroxymethylpyrimidine/phosphomethylpyrimidine kinase